VTLNLELCEKLKNGEIDCAFSYKDDVQLIKQLLFYVFPEDKSIKDYHFSNPFEVFYADVYNNDDVAIYFLETEIEYELECQEDNVFHVKQFYN
jgi:ABC-type molybdate transport system substrate-binding protein